MADHKPSPHIKKRAPRCWASLIFVLLLLTIFVPTPRIWSATKHPGRTPPATEKIKVAPPPSISFDYSITTDGQNELLIQGDTPIKSYKSFLLTNPSRLVLDVPGVSLHGNTVELPINGPELSRIRIARHPDKVRFVFVLAEGKNIRHKVIEQSNGIKVLLSLDQDQFEPTTPAVAVPQAPMETQPSPLPDRQPKTLTPSDLEKVFGSQRVSVAFHKTPIRDFAKHLSEKSGRRIEVGPGLVTSVSLRLTEVPLHTLVNAAAETIGFVLRQDGERVILLPAPDPKKGEAP